MKVFIAMMGLVTVAIAEPPVGDRYPAARSSHEDHHDHPSDLQRSLPQEYGPPEFARNSPTSGYNYDAPNSRGAGQSQYPPATVRVSFNQRFSSSNSRNSDKGYSPSGRSLSQEYSAPRSGTSQEYGLPEARSLSEEYRVPNVRSLSTEYGVPSSRSSPSEEYGVPAARSNQRPHSSPNFRNADAFAARSNVAQGYNSPRPFAKFASSFASRSASTTYGAPTARSSDSYSENLSETYGAPNSRSLSQEYGLPSSRSNVNAHGGAKNFFAPRSTPSSTYLPASRAAAPSEQYGVQQRESSQGYDSAQSRALEELLRQEPANYDFTYQIEDQESGSDFGHAETREADRTEGSYFVVLPDGTRQTVEYEADENGFKPRISVEPAGLSSGGYDDNAAEIARSDGGPY